MSATLRDWLAPALSGAITAGVAPLLFVQVLYPHAFYTANLLLHHRWMSILPVLILGFYLLYVLKSRPLVRHSKLRAAIGVVVFLCFLWTALAWTGNHLLSLQPGTEHVRFFAEGDMFHFEPSVIPRLLMWGFGAVSTMSVIVALQVRGRTGDGRDGLPVPVRQLAGLGAAGLLAAACCALIYAGLLGPHARAFIADAAANPGQLPSARVMAWPWLVMALGGFIAQLLAWSIIWKRRRLSRTPLLVCAAGSILTILGMTALREILRLVHLGRDALESLQIRHETTASVSGAPLFAVFLVVNAALVIWCLEIVRRARRA